MSTRNTIITSLLTALITSICTFFALDFVKTLKNKPKEVMVPQVVGLMPSQAMEVLDGRKLRLQIIERRADPKIPKGQICSQHPLSDSKVLAHSAVNVVLSAGPPRVSVPTCRGIKLQDYTVLLTKQKLRLGKLTYGAGEGMKPGEIVSCSPASGTVVKPEATVDLVVAKRADEEKDVPKLRGMSCTAAKKAIVEAGFTVGKVNWRAYDARPYSVVKQEPDAGTKAKAGAPIDLYCTKEDD
ncbi:MAG: PASTA domain-containing protein [bacterium]